MVRLDPRKRGIVRDIGLRHDRVDVVVRITLAGIELKGRGGRWSRAYLLPWAAAYDVAVKMHNARKAAEKKARRALRRAA